MICETENLARVFDATAGRNGARLAVRDQRGDWSFGDVLSTSEEITRLLEEDGCRPEHRVALMLPNSATFVAAFFAIARIGAVVAPLNVRYGLQELLYYLTDTQAITLLAAAPYAAIAQEALQQLQNPPGLIVIDDDGRCSRVVESRSEALSRPSDGGDPLLHQYTSGSTGKPKRVVRSHAQLITELQMLRGSLDVTERDKFLGVAPFSHVNGLVRSMLLSMFSGASLFTLASFARRRVLSLVTEEELTIFGGVPHMFVVLADSPLRDRVDLSSLRIVFSASAPLLLQDNRRFYEKYGVYVRQLYGSTETGSISMNLETSPENALESVGTPLPGVEVLILDQNRSLVAVGDEGEVAISSPAAIRSYAGNAEASAESFHDGYYLSGDLGYQLPNGALVLTGRKKFMINRGGFKVNPHEVEEAIRTHGKVDQVVVFGKPARHGDDVVACVIVAKEACTEVEIMDHCRGKIADFKIPSRVAFRDALPMTETGKILRNKL